MKHLTDFQFNNKRVLVRVDFNVPINNGRVVEDFRLRVSLPTIEYLTKSQAKVILISHLGRPNNREEKYSLYPVAKRLSELLNQTVKFIDDCIGERVEKEVQKLEPGQVILLENLRFYPGEKKNDPEFSQSLAQLAEVYINDAFGVMHREHASVVGIPKYLPSGIGFLVEKELKVLSKVLENPERPWTVVMGGAKISTKIKFIERFLKKADNLLLGGALANNMLLAQGLVVGQSVIEPDLIEQIKQIEITDSRLHLPLDVIVAKEPTLQAKSHITSIGKVNPEEMILDIGPDTRNLFKSIIQESKTIVWNGPMGLYEVEQFAQGTKEIAFAVAQTSGFSIVGGGETVVLLDKLGLLEKINHICSGGGAMLQFLSEEPLPGLVVLEECRQM